MSHDEHDAGMSRRDVLCAGGAAMFSYLLVGLLGGVRPARAQGVSGAVPEVDRLAVRVVTDSFHLAIAPNLKVGGVEVQSLPSQCFRRLPIVFQDDTGTFNQNVPESRSNHGITLV